MQRLERAEKVHEEDEKRGTYSWKRVTKEEIRLIKSTINLEKTRERVCCEYENAY